MYNPISLKNKTILITGASGGIGEATCILIDQLGGKVIMVARNEEKLKQVAESLSNKNHKYYNFDLKNNKEIEPLINKIIKENGRLDGFVHSAGISSSRPLRTVNYDFLHDMMLINFYSFIEISRCITKKNNYNENLSIVGVSSAASLKGDKAKVAYSATKAAMDGAIRVMAKELAIKKTRINNVLPAFIKTDMYDKYIEKTDKETICANILASQYLGLGEPVDVANSIVFLLSDASKFITGTSLHVDGGALSS